MGAWNRGRWGRRHMCLGAASAALLGCSRRKVTVADVDPNVGKTSSPSTIAVALPILDGRADALHKLLEQHVFEHGTGGVHYLRMLPLDDHTLLLSAVFDNSLNSLLSLLAENADRVDPILSLTSGYPEAGAADLRATADFLRAHEVRTMMLYSAFSRASEPAVREAAQLRAEFLRFVRTVQHHPATAPNAYSRFLEANRARIDTHREGAGDHLSPTTLTNPNLQNPFTMVFDLRDDWIRRLEKTLVDGQWVLDHFHIHPLKQIPTVHYARFARLSRTKILFETVYDGDWDQYVRDFAVTIPKKLDLVWGGAVDYPPKGAADADALGAFLDRHRLQRDYFYLAYSDQSVKAIQKSLALGRKLIGFSRRAPTDADALRRHVERFVHRHQTLLA